MFCAIRLQNTYNYCGFARHDSKNACDYCGFVRYESKTLTITEVFLITRLVLLIFHLFYICFFQANDFSIVFITFGASDGSEKLGTR